MEECHQALTQDYLFVVHTVVLSQTPHCLSKKFDRLAVQAKRSAAIQHCRNKTCISYCTVRGCCGKFFEICRNETRILVKNTDNFAAFQILSLLEALDVLQTILCSDNFKSICHSIKQNC